MENAITQVIVPWWVIPLILVILSAVAWFLVPPWLNRKIQDPDEWWEERMARYSLEEAETMADSYRELANRLRKVRDEEIAKGLLKQALDILEEDHETGNRMGVIREAFAIHYCTLHDCAWMDRVKMLDALDETAEVVKLLLEDTET